MKILRFTGTDVDVKIRQSSPQLASVEANLLTLPVRRNYPNLDILQDGNLRVRPNARVRLTGDRILGARTIDANSEGDVNLDSLRNGIYQLSVDDSTPIPMAKVNSPSDISDENPLSMNYYNAYDFYFEMYVLEGDITFLYGDNDFKATGRTDTCDGTRENQCWISHYSDFNYTIPPGDYILEHRDDFGWTLGLYRIHFAERPYDDIILKSVALNQDNSYKIMGNALRDSDINLEPVDGGDKYTVRSSKVGDFIFDSVRLSIGDSYRIWFNLNGVEYSKDFILELVG